MPDINTDITKAAKDIANVAKDATYVVIGAGVLGFQQAQVQRQRAHAASCSEPVDRLADRVSTVRERPDRGRPAPWTPRVEDLMDRVEEIIERVEAVVRPLRGPAARPGP